MLAHRLCDFLVAPISNISWRWAFTSSYIPRSKSLQANRCSHLTSGFLACSCSSLGHSSRPWRFSSSKIQSFWGPQVGFSEVLIRRTTSGTLLAGVTIPTTTLVGMTVGQAPRFIKQISTQEELVCNSPYVAVSTMEVGNQEPCADSVSTWTCIQCPQTSVLP